MVTGCFYVAFWCEVLAGLGTPRYSFGGAGGSVWGGGKRERRHMDDRRNHKKDQQINQLWLV